VVCECQSGVEQVGTGVNNSDLNSNIGREIGYPDKRFSRLSSVRPRESRNVTLSYVTTATLYVISVSLLSVKSMPYSLLEFLTLSLNKQQKNPMNM
jgi:hypothetical protein